LLNCNSVLAFWRESEMAALAPLCSLGPRAKGAGTKMITEKAVAIADLDVELTAIGGYDSVSGMPCGCVHGPIRPWIRPESADDVLNLIPASAEK
jgi:hypothetical protein